MQFYPVTLKKEKEPIKKCLSGSILAKKRIFNSWEVIDLGLWSAECIYVNIPEAPEERGSGEVVIL